MMPASGSSLTLRSSNSSSVSKVCRAAGSLIAICSLMKVSILVLERDGRSYSTPNWSSALRMNDCVSRRMSSSFIRSQLVAHSTGRASACTMVSSSADSRASASWPPIHRDGASAARRTTLRNTAKASTISDAKMVTSRNHATISSLGSSVDHDGVRLKMAATLSHIERQIAGALSATVVSVERSSMSVHQVPGRKRPSVLPASTLTMSAKLLTIHLASSLASIILVMALMKSCR